MVRSAAAVLAFATALGAVGCIRARGTPEEPVVVELRLEGVRSVDGDRLREKLATQASGRFAWQDAWRLDPDALSVDRRRVEAFYRERGYYEARVDSVELVPAGRGRVRVVMRVVEGKPVRVSTLVVKGLEGAGDAAARVGKLPLRPGEIFTEGAYDATRNAVASALRSTGWATAEVTQSALVLPEDGTAEVTYEAEPGPRWKFGPIFIAGTSALPRDRIRQQVLGALRPGDWFDDGRLAVAQARVFDLGVFGGVRVTRGQPDPRRGTIPVVVAVREAPFRTLRFGPGLGFQATRWDAHALVGWQHRNFYGQLRRLQTEARVGYAWLPTPVRSIKEGTVALVSGEFSQPGAFTRYVDTSARLELEKGVQDAYDFYSERIRLGLPLRIAPRWSLVPSYNLEIYQLSNYGVDVDFGVSSGGGPILENCRGSVCLLSYLEQRIAWDGRDNAVNTRRGYYVAMSVQEGFNLAAYGYRYLRFQPEVRAFWPFGSRMVLATRARIGALVPVEEEGEPPLVARFTAGGPLSMRGYYTRRLSKMVRQRGDWVAVGGNGLADATVELRIDLPGNLGSAIFLDAGNAADSSAVPSTWQTALDPTLLQFAAGFGLRYQTPFGPIRLDVAARLPERLPLNEADSFPAVPFTTWEDGKPHREPILAVHLSLGEAF
jgi:translocation and assembly module TamA